MARPQNHSHLGRWIFNTALLRREKLTRATSRVFFFFFTGRTNNTVDLTHYHNNQIPLPLSTSKSNRLKLTSGGSCDGCKKNQNTKEHKWWWWVDDVLYGDWPWLGGDLSFLSEEVFSSSGRRPSPYLKQTGNAEYNVHTQRPGSVRYIFITRQWIPICLGAISI